MSAYTHPAVRAIPEATREAAWFAVLCGVAFLIPYVGVSLLDLPHDVFYLVYFAIAIGLIATYVRTERIDVETIFRRRWRWSLGVGVVVASFLVFNVFKTSDATARPHGAYFVFELLWRGLGYGIVDTLLLTILPLFVAYKLLHGRVDGPKGKLRLTAVTLPLVIIITATYHLGYPQYRQDGLSRPEIGNVLISVPTFATANPLGSLVAHVSQHITAVTHAYESRIFNPPVTPHAASTYPDRVGDVAPGAGPDIASISLSNTRTTVTFRVRFASAPPLRLSTRANWVDMLLIGIDVPPIGPPPVAPGGEWRGANFFLGTHGPSKAGKLVRLGDGNSLRPPATFKIATDGATLTFAIPRRALGNPNWFVFSAAAARELQQETGGGLDLAPARGTYRYTLN
jgi:hypothetical protein